MAGLGERGGRCLESFVGQLQIPPESPDSCQSLCLDRISQAYLKIGKPPVLSAVGAFKELCGNRVPYISEDGGPEPYIKGTVFLPDGGGVTSLDGATFPSAHLDLLSGSPARLLNGPRESADALDECGLTSPYMDAAFRSPAVYGEFIQSLLSRDLVELAPESPSLLGCFFVRKNQGSSV